MYCWLACKSVHCRFSYLKTFFVQVIFHPVPSSCYVRAFPSAIHPKLPTPQTLAMVFLLCNIFPDLFPSSWSRSSSQVILFHSMSTYLWSQILYSNSPLHLWLGKNSWEDVQSISVSFTDDSDLLLHEMWICVIMWPLSISISINHCVSGY